MYYRTYRKIHIAADALRLYCDGIRDEFKHDFALTALNQILDALADEDILAPEKSEDPEDTDGSAPAKSPDTPSTRASWRNDHADE